MDCEGLRARLDAYIDGELPEEEARALVNHAKACDACRRELEAAELLRDALANLDENVSVPLEAQAAWRGVVRAEAKRRAIRKWTRLACAAAAALVLVLGGSLMLKGAPQDGQTQPLALSVDSDTAEGLIARDGGDVVHAESEPEDAYAAWKKIATDQPAAALETLEALAEEYNGECAVEGEDVCRIALPCAYLEDFLNAASRIGTELDSETGDTSADTAIVYIQLCKE